MINITTTKKGVFKKERSHQTAVLELGKIVKCIEDRMINSGFRNRELIGDFDREVQLYGSKKKMV